MVGEASSASHAGTGLLMRFPGCECEVNCYLDQLSVGPPKPDLWAALSLSWRPEPRRAALAARRERRGLSTLERRRSRGRLLVEGEVVELCADPEAGCWWAPTQRPKGYPPSSAHRRHRAPPRPGS